MAVLPYFVAIFMMRDTDEKKISCCIRIQAWSMGMLEKQFYRAAADIPWRRNSWCSSAPLR